MRHFEYIGPKLAESGGNAAKDPWTIVDLNAQINDAVFALEFAIDDRGQNARIDIAAAQYEPHRATAKMGGIGEHRGESGSSRSLGQRLLMREIGHHRPLDIRFPDEPHIVDELF